MPKKTLIMLGAASVLAAAVQVDAQKNTNSTVTLTGCLQRAGTTQQTPSRATAPTGTSGTSAAADQFVLIDARVGTGLTSGSSGANGQSAAAPSSGGTVSGTTPNATGNAAVKGSQQRTNVTKGPWYSVSGNSDDLRSRMNHRVEITGTLDTEGSVVGTSASATDGPSGTIHARSIKVISASCSQ